MKKNSTMATNRNEIFNEPKLTIGLDLGDRSSHYCILDEAGNVILEHNLPTTPKGIDQVFSRIPRSRIALETGTHSPWVSRQLTELGHEVIAAHARNVRLIGERSRKDDQLDARTLARLARIDPGLLGPVRHRSAKAQIHLTVIRARAALVGTRTPLVNAARGLTKSYGERLKKCGTEQMSRESAKGLSQQLRDALDPSLTASRSLCLQPKYRSVVCTLTCPNNNRICSTSPPDSWQSRAHVLRRSCGANLSILALEAHSRTMHQTTFSVIPCSQMEPVLFTHRNSFPVLMFALYS